MMARSPARVFGAGKDVFQMPPWNGKSGMRANPGAANDKAATSVTMMNLTKEDYSCFWKIFIGLQQVHGKQGKVLRRLCDSAQASTKAAIISPSSSSPCSTKPAAAYSALAATLAGA